MNTNEKSITNLREAWDLVLRTINYKLDASYLAAICFCLNCINMNKETDIEIPEPLERERLRKSKILLGYVHIY